MIDPLPLPLTPAGATGPEPGWRRGCGPDDPGVIALGLLPFLVTLKAQIYTNVNLQCNTNSPNSSWPVFLLSHVFH